VVSDIDHRSFRHWGGFLFSGGVAFLVDAGITTGLIKFAAADPFSARFIAVVIAMVVAWLMHRRVTFNVQRSPSWGEFLRFAAVAWSASALNYFIYAAILLVRPTTMPILALIVSSGAAAIFSYVGFRLGVFRQPPSPG
jgi:putative flippase GtrA